MPPVPHSGSPPPCRVMQYLYLHVIIIMIIKCSVSYYTIGSIKGLMAVGTHSGDLNLLCIMMEFTGEGRTCKQLGLTKT